MSKIKDCPRCDYLPPRLLSKHGTKRHMKFRRKYHSQHSVNHFIGVYEGHTTNDVYVPLLGKRKQGKARKA